MTSKLRPIRTTSRAATVKRSDVASAAKAVTVSRSARDGRFVALSQEKRSDRSRK